MDATDYGELVKRLRGREEGDRFVGVPFGSPDADCKEAADAIEQQGRTIASQLAVYRDADDRATKIREALETLAKVLEKVQADLKWIGMTHNLPERTLAALGEVIATICDPELLTAPGPGEGDGWVRVNAWHEFPPLEPGDRIREVSMVEAVSADGFPTRRSTEAPIEYRRRSPAGG